MTQQDKQHYTIIPFIKPECRACMHKEIHIDAGKTAYLFCELGQFKIRPKAWCTEFKPVASTGEPS